MLKQTPTKLVKTNHATISFDGKSIVISELENDTEISLEDVIEHRRIIHEFTGGKRHAVLAIAGQHTTATKEAREYSSQNIPEGRVAEAIVITSMPVRLMGRIFINFHKPGLPTKLFETKEEALVWLEQILSND
ncbi:MAG: hypothetical protein JNK50_05150 [Bacteroidia bacterium]|nr:hypothetical protein [Bacteroidia bacterium]